MNKQKGFTVIELIVVTAFLITVAILGFSQWSKLTNEKNNAAKRTAINAIYYSLEEDFYKRNGYYPEKIDDKTLPTMDAALLTDPAGVKLGEGTSSYRYESTDCSDSKCRSYTIRTSLVGEDDYVKESRNK